MFNCSHIADIVPQTNSNWWLGLAENNKLDIDVDHRANLIDLWRFLAMADVVNAITVIWVNKGPVGFEISKNMMPVCHLRHFLRV
jgi:hypothetical protein